MGNKKVLVIDVDETLLNLEPLFYLKRFKKNYQKNKGNLIQFGKGQYYGVLRPRVREFLDKAKEDFDLVAFSVVNKEITKQKLNLFGLEKYFTKIYGKEDLINKKKSLKLIAKDFKISLNQIVALDDQPEIFEEANVLKVKPWFIGDNKEYEYQSHSDNLIGAFELAKRNFSKMISSENQIFS